MQGHLSNLSVYNSNMIFQSNQNELFNLVRMPLMLMTLLLALQLELIMMQIAEDG